MTKRILYYNHLLPNWALANFLILSPNYPFVPTVTYLFLLMNRVIIRFGNAGLEFTYVQVGYEFAIVPHLEECRVVILRISKYESNAQYLYNC